MRGKEGGMVRRPALQGPATSCNLTNKTYMKNPRSLKRTTNLRHTRTFSLLSNRLLTVQVCAEPTRSVDQQGLVT